VRIKRVEAAWLRTVARLSLGGIAAAGCSGSEYPAIDAEFADAVAAAYPGPTALGAGGSSAGAGGSASVPNSADTSLGGSAALPPLEANGGSAGLGGRAGLEGASGSAQAGSSSLPASGTGGSAPATTACDGFAILAANCGTSGCHGEGSNLGTFAASESAARGYIGKNGAVTCAGQGPIIDPSDPASSMLVQKMGDDPPCGNYMPLAGALLSDAEIACIEDWMAHL